MTRRPKLRTAAEASRGDRLPRINLRVTKDMLRRLKEKAQLTNRSVNSVCRRAIAELLKHPV